MESAREDLWSEKWRPRGQVATTKELYGSKTNSGLCVQNHTKTVNIRNRSGSSLDHLTPILRAPERGVVVGKNLLLECKNENTIHMNIHDSGGEVSGFCKQTSR